MIHCTHMNHIGIIPLVSNWKMRGEKEEKQYLLSACYGLGMW